MQHGRPLKLLLPAALLTALGCAKPAPRAEAVADPQPLGIMADARVIVLPVQHLSFSDSLGWRSSVPDRAAYLATVDDEIAFALTERGLDRKWVFARAIVASSKRNPIAPDPRTLNVEALRGRLPEPLQSLSESLRTQVRALVAVDGSRYALLPVEMRLEGARGTGRAVLRVVLIDSRMAQVRWAADLNGNAVRAFGPPLAAGVASRLADLVVTP